jgi:uncharacterized protein (TIGR02453 family)
MLEQSLSFLSQLKENNDKEWFHDNKALYDSAKKEFETFVSNLISEVNQIDPTVGMPNAKDCIFRIFRDLRFSNDKTPYKTNFGAYMVRGGTRNSEYGGYYFHLQPGSSALAGGIWMPQPDVLKAVRNDIFHLSDEFLGILSAAEFKKHFGELDEEYMLKTAPKDFPKDWPHVKLLKYKSYTMSKPLSDDLILSGNLIDEVQKGFMAMKPLNVFLNQIIEDLRNP